MSAPRSYEAAKASVVGNREINQDRSLFLASGETLLLGLADGLGGHPRGEVAAQLLVDVCEALFRRAPKPIEDPESFMLQCIGKAHSAIMHYGRRQTPPVAPRTTAVLALVQGGIAHWAHVGDSRLYLIRGRQVFAQTRDHAQVRFVRERADEASRPRASLTRCLGGLPQPPTTTCGPPTLLQHGDVIVLCSDGLWGQIATQPLVEALSDGGTPIDRALHALVERASAMPGSDNVTAVALRWHVAAGGPAEESPRDAQVGRAVRHLHSVLDRYSEQD